jgi:hypothetical protein
MSDQQGSVRRVATTRPDVAGRKADHPKEGDEGGAQDGRPWRTGVADGHRRAAIRQPAHARSLEAWAPTPEPTPVLDVAASWGRPVRGPRQRLRALNPLAAADRALLAAGADGAGVRNGFGNRDLRQRLEGVDRKGAAARKRRSAAVTRKRRRLRAHGLIRPVPQSHRYQVTVEGRRQLTALRAACHAAGAQLTQAVENLLGPRRF